MNKFANFLMAELLNNLHITSEVAEGAYDLSKKPVIQPCPADREEEISAA